MNIPRILITVVLASLTACDKSPAPSASSSSSSSKPADAVQLKLQEYAGSSPSDCGRLDVRAMQANQSKKPFVIAYDMPGMTVGVAGNSEGKLFTVQSQAGGSTSSGACPSQLRLASSGRVTCFAPGDMGSMSGSHAAGSVPAGAPNPHAGESKPPSN
jgi:hypothetical protein